MFPSFDLPEPGKYFFKVTETKGGGTGWINDTDSAFYITVEVTSSDPSIPGAELQYEITVDGADEIVFTNTYKYVAQPPPPPPTGDKEDPKDPVDDPKDPGDTPNNPDGDTPSNPGGDTPNNPGGDTPDNPGGDTPDNPGDTPSNPGGETDTPPSGGTDLLVPPIPNLPGNTVTPAPDPDGKVPDVPERYIEIGNDGKTPVGEWNYDREHNIWVYTPYPPAADVPPEVPTGDTANTALYIAIALVSLTSGAAIIIGNRKRKRV